MNLFSFHRCDSSCWEQPCIPKYAFLSEIAESWGKGICAWVCQFIWISREKMSTPSLTVLVMLLGLSWWSLLLLVLVTWPFPLLFSFLPEIYIKTVLKNQWLALLMLSAAPSGQQSNQLSCPAMAIVCLSNIQQLLLKEIGSNFTCS